jgi:hypothetical protein
MYPSLDDLLGAFNASGHPDVISGDREAEDIVRELIDAFSDPSSPEDTIEYQKFEDFYSNLSAYVEDDAYFKTIMEQTWNLSDHAPQPAKHKFIAKQTHGDYITWKQEASHLERTSEQPERFKKVSE